MLNDNTLIKNVLILITCVIKDKINFISNSSWEKHFLLSKYGIQQDGGIFLFYVYSVSHSTSKVCQIQ